MGAQGTEAGIQRALVLDAGALIAYGRGHQRARSLVNAGAAVSQIVIPAGALAQAWRGGPGAAPLAHLIRGTTIDPLDEERAKEVGARLGCRGTRDVNDAHVVCFALQRRAVIVTSDPTDMEALTHPGEPLKLIVV